MLHLKDYKQYPVATGVYSHIQTFQQSMNVDQIKYLIDNSLLLEQVRELQQAISIAEDLRVMDVCKSAIVAAIAQCFSINYIVDNGCYDWKSILKICKKPLTKRLMHGRLHKHLQHSAKQSNGEYGLKDRSGPEVGT